MQAHNPWKPFVYFSLIAFGLCLGIWLKPSGSSHGITDELVSLAENYYVDSVDADELKRSAVEGMLASLDPHTVHIPAEELQETNEPLDGSFEGIGVEFTIVDDTVLVVTPIHGGVSEQLGILSGDRIVQVDGKNIAGTGITNDQVIKLLKGERGTTVKVGIYRRGHRGIILFNIRRDKIPIYSVDASFMINPTSGYIKISRFSATTYDEFREKLDGLKKPKNLVIDLRGNPGGYLNAATQIADELIGGTELIVYTEGLHQKRSEFRAGKTGRFETGTLILLIDEGSASASEILAGAIQDHDRGIIVGRRSFGKGLVQETVALNDGSELRLTVARYYTPSGRCIQKPYTGKSREYENEVNDRFENGELTRPDTFHSGKPYKTASGRTVYGGGGITPDVFVPIDTQHRSEFYRQMVQQGLLLRFAYTESDRGKSMFQRCKTVADFEKAWQQILPDMPQRFGAFAAAAQVTTSVADVSFLLLNAKAIVARQYLGENGYSQIHATFDPAMKQVGELLAGK